MKKKYELIIDYIEQLVSEQKIKQGESLPSIRLVANKFNYNKSTVIRAYKELEMRHKIYSIPKGGFYLVEKKIQTVKTDTKIDFSEVMPDPNLLPYKEFNHCINRAVELYKDTLFTYSNTEGLQSLRKTLVSHFRNYQIFTTEERIVITSGAQQALSILAKMPFSNNKENILIEQPTYGLMKKIIELNGQQIVGISRDENGIDFARLEAIFKYKNIKFFYTMPRFQNPLGTSYSEKEKNKIIELANKYDVYIVEDDYLVDLDMSKKRLPAFYYDLCDRVIYVKSFSKAFMPGIRIGAVILPENLKLEFLLHKKCYDLNTSVLAQGALELFINSGMYEKHLKKTQIQYRKKFDALKEYANHNHINGVQFFIPESGFFIWVQLTKNFDLRLLKKRLVEKNVLISLADELFINENFKKNGFYICISKLSEKEIKVGFHILCDEIAKLLRE